MTPTSHDENPLRPFDAAGGFVVLDGGLSTQLETLGADLRDALWTARLLIEDPARVAEAHRAFFDAGADVAITASYQASVDGFVAKGLTRDHATSALAGSIEIARAARDAWWADDRAAGAGRLRPLVAASVGPYGATRGDGSEYTGALPIAPSALEAFHHDRLAVLLGSRPDLLAIETIPSLVEAVAVLRALAAFPDARAWVSFTCRDATSLADGSPFAAAVEVVADDPHVVAVGVNCTAPAAIAPLVATAARMALPVVAYPNHGATWDAEAKVWDGAPADDLAHLVPSWIDAGARLIGGCCGIDAAALRPIARAVRAA